MSDHIHRLAASHSPVFLLNSRLGRFSAPRSREGPFSRSYGASLPSSLAVTHSSAFGCSPRPPVSVSGTGPLGLKLSGFSWKRPSTLCPLPRRAGVLSRIGARRVLHCARHAYLASTRNSVCGRRFRHSVPASQHRGARECQPVTRRGTLQRQGPLRTRLTLARLASARKPWSSGVSVSRTHCRYSCLHLPFRGLHRASRRGFQAGGMLPYRCVSASHGFGGRLHARSSSTPARSTGELLRTL